MDGSDEAPVLRRSRAKHLRRQQAGDPVLENIATTAGGEWMRSGHTTVCLTLPIAANGRMSSRVEMIDVGQKLPDVATT